MPWGILGKVRVVLGSVWHSNSMVDLKPVGVRCVVGDVKCFAVGGVLDEFYCQARVGR